MKIKPDTDFLVKPGEVITVTVLASDTVYLAGFSPLSFGEWTIVSPPNPEVRKFTAPEPDVPLNSFGIAFDFAPAADPAIYHVTIVGDPAEDTFPPPQDPGQGDVTPSPPLPTNRRYRFVTS